MRKNIRGFTPASATAVAFALLLILLITSAYSSTPSTQSNSIATQNSLVVQSNLITNFTAIGLPQGATWNMSYDNASIESNSITATFSTQPGTYGFSVQPYYWKTGNGTIALYPITESGTGTAGNDYIVYFNASINFTESGLPKGATWVVTFAGRTKLANASSSMVFDTQCIYCNTTYLVDPRSYNGIIYVPNKLSGVLGSNNISVAFSVFNTSIANATSTSSNNALPPKPVLNKYAGSVEALNLTSVNVTNSSINGTVTGSGAIIATANYTNISLRTNTKTIKGLYIHLKGPIGAPIRINAASSVSSPGNVRPFNNPVFQYFVINQSFYDTNESVDGNVSYVRYNFTVTKAWASEHNISSGNVRLYKYSYSNDTWYALPTAYDGENRTNYFYTAFSDSMSTYVVSFGSGSGTSAASPISVTVSPITYRHYIFGVAAYTTGSPSATELTGVNWTVNATDSESVAAGPNFNAAETSVGQKTGATGTATFNAGGGPGAASYAAIAGIGLNVSNIGQLGKTTNTSAVNANLTLNYSVSVNSSFVVLVGTIGAGYLSSLSIPAGCSVYQNVTDGTQASVFIAACQDEATGSYSVSMHGGAAAAPGGPGGPGAAAIVPVSTLVAYQYYPRNVTFYDSPTSATVSTNSKTYTNGQVAHLLGRGVITSNPPQNNFIFTGWKSSSATNISIYTPSSQTTEIYVSGSGSITASYNGITTFNESGLPAGTAWNVTYDGLLNSSATGKITFDTLPGTYSFSVANQIVNGTTYLPSPRSGNLSAGTTQFVLFSQVGKLSFSLQSNTTQYAASDLATATAPLPNETIELLVGKGTAKGSLVASGTGSVSCNADGTCNPPSNVPLAAGTYNITAYVPATGQSKSLELTINKATPRLSLTVPASFVYDGSGGTVSYSISTALNQLLGTLYVNNVLSSSTYTSASYTTSSATGAYDEVLNTTGNANYTSASKTASFSILPATFKFLYSTASTATAASPGSVSLPFGYSNYLCEAGVDPAFPKKAPTESWIVNINSSSGAGGPGSSGISASIGHQTSDTCTAYDSGGAGSGMTLAGLGINDTHYSVYTAAGNVTDTASLTYPVATNNTFTALLISSGTQKLTSETVPANCTVAQSVTEGAVASSYLAVCTQNPGAYTVSATTSGNGALAIAAYTFPAPKVTFDDNPTSGFVSANGKNYTNGEYTYLIGSGTITAHPPSKFVFHNWTVSNSNVSIQSLRSQTTIATISGNATVTATYFGTTIFNETGLPSNTLWSVTYDNITNSSYSPSDITFSTIAGKHQFEVPNVTITNATGANTIYEAFPSKGNLSVGNSTVVTFAVIGKLTLALQSNTTSYNSSDKITATAPLANETIDILIGKGTSPGTQVASGTGTVSCNADSTCNYPSDKPLPAGTYNVSAYLPATGKIISEALVVNKAVPKLELSVPASYTYDGQGGTITYSISTALNQLEASLYLNSVLISATQTSGTYTTSSSVGKYAAVLNTTGNANYTSASVARNFSILSAPYVVLYDTNETSGAADPTDLDFPSTYKLYVCGAGVSYSFTGGNPGYSWTQDVGSTATVAGATEQVTSIGHQTSDICYDNPGTNGGPGAIPASTTLAGIALNQTRYVLNSLGSSSTTSASLFYQVPKNGTFSAILVDSGAYPLSKVQIPANCTVKGFINGTYSSSFVAVCNNMQSGFYSVNASTKYSAGISIAVYDFGPFAVHMNINAPNGQISTDKKTFTDGELAYLVGTGSIAASTSNSSFKFINWTVLNPSNITLSSLTSPNTTATISGNGTISANYKGRTSFDETGLPSIPTLPSSIAFFANITIYNNQSVATHAPFQQLIQVNSSKYSSFEASNLQNIEFFYPNGTVIPSWLEGGVLPNGTVVDTYANAGKLSKSDSTSYWLNISEGLPANSKYTIYIGFAPISDNLMNKLTTGEAPQLSQTYSEYDNGGKVFLYYNNGSTTSGFTLPNGGTIGTASETGPYGSSANVITLSGSGSVSTSSEAVAWLDSPLSTGNVILNGWINTEGNGNALFAARGGSDTTLTNYILGDGWTGAEAAVFFEKGTTNAEICETGASATGWYWLNASLGGQNLDAAVYSAPPNLGGAFQNGAPCTNSSLSSQNKYVGISAWAGSASPSYFYTFWARAYPPNDIMPAYKVGSSVLSSSYIAPWNVTYDGIKNASTSSTITFFTYNGSYAFAVPNVSIDGVVYQPSPSSGALDVGSTKQITFSEVGKITLLVQSNPTKYNSSDTVTASAPLSSDSVEIKVGTSLSSLATVASGTGSVSCNLRSTCNPPSNVPLAAGSYYVEAYVPSTGQSLDEQVTINKATPRLSLAVPASFVYDGSGGQVTYEIGTALNQLEGVLYQNGADVASTYTIGSYTTSPSIGTYNFTFNTTGNANYTSASQTSSFAILPKTFSIPFSTSSTAGTSNPEIIVMPSTYRVYFCEAGVNPSFPTSPPTESWIVNINSSSGAAGSGISASIGHQTSDTCEAYDTGGAGSGITLAGLGINDTHYSVYTAAGNVTDTASLTYPVATNNTLTALFISSGTQKLTSETVPANCTVEQSVTEGAIASSYLAVCKDQASGSYTVSATTSGNGALAIAAYTFPAPKVTFDDNPTSGFVSANGKNYTNGGIAYLIGSGTITAHPQSKFIFHNWTVSNSINLTVSDSLAESTNLTVVGNGIVTANYYGVTVFNESGLPSGLRWNVTYDGIANSTASPGGISFVTPPGNFLFSVNNVTTTNATYAPKPAKGSLGAGNSTLITFSLVGKLTLALESNTIGYNESDVITATAPFSNETVELLVGKGTAKGSLVASGTGSVSCNADGTCNPPSNVPLAAGTYNISAYLPAKNETISKTLTITKKTPKLSLTVPASYVYDGVGGLISFSISSFADQLNGSFFVNSAKVETTNSVGSYTTSPSIGTYTEVFNTTGNANYTNASITKSFSIVSAPYIVLYDTNETSGAADPTDLDFPSTYKLYVCGAGVSYSFTGGSPGYSWTQNVESTATVAGSTEQVTSVGHQTSDVCYDNPGTNGGPGAIPASTTLAGIALNQTHYQLFSFSGNNTVSASFTYPVANNNTFSAILVDSGAYPLSKVQIPANCTVKEFINGTYSSSFVAVCNNMQSGTYSVVANTTGSAGISIAVYNFGSFPVKIVTSPANATVTTDKKVFSNNQTAYLVGYGELVASPPNSRFRFVQWTVNNPSNLSIVNALASTTNITVYGSGTLTASFNGITTFEESGLPANTLWNVTYDGVTNQSTGLNISFFTVPGDEFYSIPDVFSSSGTYIPNVSDGYLYSGSVQKVSFKLEQTCTISLNTSNVNFEPLFPGNSLPTNYGVIDTNNGSSSAIVVIGGTLWNSTAARVDFGASNTSYDNAAGVLYPSAYHITTNLTASSITVSPVSESSIYFGLNVPPRQYSSTYQQQIYIENSC
ncbi:PGF-pre-PGF domain-containing protein [Candidatus Marsarchaeota archaeon]|nr:PGF-pre-PGF domain-containing protein [Candidatus Marsarchaeota archaeon]